MYYDFLPSILYIDLFLVFQSQVRVNFARRPSLCMCTYSAYGN